MTRLRNIVLVSYYHLHDNYVQPGNTDLTYNDTKDELKTYGGRHVVKQGLDWISKTWTGFVKHGFVKHGFVKGRFVKHGFVKGGFVKHGLTRCFSHS